MTILRKISGLALIGAGIVLMYVGYTVTMAISALGGWIADQVGATGTAAVGITLLSFVPILGLIFIIGVGIVVVTTMGFRRLK